MQYLQYWVTHWCKTSCSRFCLTVGIPPSHSDILRRISFICFVFAGAYHYCMVSFYRIWGCFPFCAFPYRCLGSSFELGSFQGGAEYYCFVVCAIFYLGCYLLALFSRASPSSLSVHFFCLPALFCLFLGIYFVGRVGGLSFGPFGCGP